MAGGRRGKKKKKERKKRAMLFGAKNEREGKTEWGSVVKVGVGGSQRG